MKKGFNFKLNLVAAAVMITSVANSGVTNAAGTSNRNDFEVNSCNISVMGASPSVSMVTLTEAPRSLFTEFANPYILNLDSLNFIEINGLIVSAWNDNRSRASTLYSTLGGDNIETKQYHLNTNGFQGNSALIGRSSVVLQALSAPTPEPKKLFHAIGRLGTYRIINSLS